MLQYEGKKTQDAIAAAEAELEALREAYPAWTDSASE